MRELKVSGSVTISWKSSGFYDTFRGRDHSLNFFETTVMSIHVADDHKEMFESLDKGCYDHRNVTTSIFQLWNS